MSFVFSRYYRCALLHNTAANNCCFIINGKNACAANQNCEKSSPHCYSKCYPRKICDAHPQLGFQVNSSGASNRKQEIWIIKKGKQKNLIRKTFIAFALSRESENISGCAVATLRLDNDFLSRKSHSTCGLFTSTSVQEDFLTNIFLPSPLSTRVKREKRLRFIASFNILLLRKLFAQLRKNLC